MDATLAFRQLHEAGVFVIPNPWDAGSARTIVEATPLPVSADLENGFGDDPETVAETIRRAAEAGLAGGSIEDATGKRDRPIYERGHAERVAAAAEAARVLPLPFVRDVLYVAGLRDLESIRIVCGPLSKPVTVVMGLAGSSFSVDELAGASFAELDPFMAETPKR